MHFGLRFTTHYYLYHRRVPKDLVAKVVSTVKRRKVGKDLFVFESKSKKQDIYVLCRYDKENNLLFVINAKFRR